MGQILGRMIEMKPENVLGNNQFRYRREKGSWMQLR